MCEATGIGLLGSVLLRRFPLVRPLLGIVLITLLAMITSTGVVVALFGFSPEQAAIELSAACVAALVSLNIGLLRRVDGRPVTVGAARRTTAPPRWDVVAEVSRDLRVPLARLRATVESAQADAPSEQQSHLGRISTDLDRLGDQLDGLLRLSRIQADGLDPRPSPVELDVLAREVAARFGTIAAERGTTLRVDVESVEVPADRTMLAEALSTLVITAIHHGGYGGTVSISTGIDADRAVVTIDSEPGQAAADTGAGDDAIGLAVADEIIRAHHGTLMARLLPHRHRRHLRIPLG
ncbi:sensor histidine kinase KdpD [Saccharopolyspora gloriosae]|uniref:sensor histidine kinase n=1 Tax=Saccharopolyspora gloriosae TaxID=455344 RepID=UPI001FB6E036|nr:HAMP domain-containing sensor histidine kinase [Saccharopolyspora gloriosae]